VRYEVLTLRTAHSFFSSFSDLLEVWMKNLWGEQNETQGLKRETIREAGQIKGVLLLLVG
jgi:hypothetical protein